MKFSTYAVTVIMGEIRQYLREYGVIKTSRSLKELAGEGLQSTTGVFERYGKNRPFPNWKRRQSLPEEIAAALEIAQPVSSLQEIVHGNDGTAITLKTG